MAVLAAVVVAGALLAASPAGAQELTADAAPGAALEVPAGTDPAAEVPLVAVEVAADGTLEVDRYLADDLAEAHDVAEHLAADPATVSVGVDVAVQTTASDPKRSEQWALNWVKYESTWPTTTGGWVKVAVIDTGVRASHEDLGSVVLPGIDYVSGSDGRIDPNGHGTHVAGIIAARVGNGRGIAGAAPGVRILPVRALDANGSGSSADVIDGIVWAVDHGARVINLSLGATSPIDPMRAAIQYANSKGAVVVAAGGNGYLNGNQVLYPAAYPEPIAVAAVTVTLQRAEFSNVGSYIDLAAPGDGIISTYSSSDSSYAYASGTSMASPYVAAAAALVIAARPEFSASEVRAALEGSAQDLGWPGLDTSYGHGLVNPPRAVWTFPATAKKGTGYWLVTSDGRVRRYGATGHYGDLGGRALSKPVVAAASTPSGKGYWLAGADGAVYAFGDAPYRGALTGTWLKSPIVGMASTPTGKGYYLLGADGGIFSFGDAKFFGSTGNLRLKAPVVDMAPTPTGKGYYLVATDGGIFAFGDARFRGSTGNLRLDAPVTSMTVADDGRGYWLIARDGGIFTFGVPFLGSLPGIGMKSAVGTSRVRALADGSGYYVLDRRGSMYSFGAAKYWGAAAPLSPYTIAVDLMLAPGS
ncbi:MAG TPA: S8 family serine peptidase [Acidimicrobiia bacterium]|nr:S8 family serine peptidase [Acidimicrobiia bacterium]